jgi:hypothetical protein
MRDQSWSVFALPLALVMSACGTESVDPIGSRPDFSAYASASAIVERPLTGNCQTVYEFVDFEFLPPPQEDVPARGTIHHTGTCLLAHLGATALTKDEVIDFTVFPAHVEGQLTLTAANGDQLSGRESSDVRPPDDSGVFEAVGRWTFAGGTGRFEDASGTALFTAAGSVNDNTTTRVLNGRLSY